MLRADVALRSRAELHFRLTAASGHRPLPGSTACCYRPLIAQWRGIMYRKIYRGQATFIGLLVWHDFHKLHLITAWIKGMLILLQYKQHQWQVHYELQTAAIPQTDTTVKGLYGTRYKTRAGQRLMFNQCIKLFLCYVCVKKNRSRIMLRKCISVNGLEHVSVLTYRQLIYLIYRIDNLSYLA